MKPFNKYFDHTCLKPEATSSDIKKLCAEARKHDFYSVCVNGCYVKLAAGELSDSDVKVAAVIGFPLGAVSPEVKVLETNDCRAGEEYASPVCAAGHPAGQRAGPSCISVLRPQLRHAFAAPGLSL